MSIVNFDKTKTAKMNTLSPQVRAACESALETMALMADCQLRNFEGTRKAIGLELNPNDCAGLLVAYQISGRKPFGDDSLREGQKFMEDAAYAIAGNLMPQSYPTAIDSLLKLAKTVGIADGDDDLVDKYTITRMMAKHFGNRCKKLGFNTVGLPHVFCCELGLPLTEGNLDLIELAIEQSTIQMEPASIDALAQWIRASRVPQKREAREWYRAGRSMGLNVNDVALALEQAGHDLGIAKTPFHNA